MKELQRLQSEGRGQEGVRRRFWERGWRYGESGMRALWPGPDWRYPLRNLVGDEAEGIGWVEEVVGRRLDGCSIDGERGGGLGCFLCFLEETSWVLYMLTFGNKKIPCACIS